MSGKKLKIQDQTVPCKLRIITPHHSNFQPIHLEGSLTKGHPNHTTGHSDPLGQLRLLLLQLSKWDPPSVSVVESHFPFPHWSTFFGFSFRERASHPSPRSYFNFMTQHSKWIMNEDKNPNFSTAPQQFSSNFRNDDVFWSGATEIVWRGVVVNFQLKKDCHLS
ncbi:hypothetical protein AVEN_186710-1, partial [Araneus ventricosus]